MEMANRTDKNWISHGIPFLIKRGSKEEPLYLEEMKKITIEFLKTKSEIEHFLQEYTPKKVMEELDNLSRRLP